MRRGSGRYRDASAAPPDSDATTAVTGACSGLTLRDRPSVWELLADSSDEVAGATAMTQLLRQIDESPRFRRAQVAGALAEIREQLRVMGWQEDPSTEVSLQAGTVAIIADLLLRHQP